MTKRLVPLLLVSMVLCSIALAGCSGGGTADGNGPAEIKDYVPPTTTTTGTVDGAATDSTSESDASASPDDATVSSEQPQGSLPPGSLGGTKGVELVRVGYAAENNYLIVQFRAPQEVSRHWQAGYVWVEDEATHQRYAAIPVAPVVGPLLSRPKVDGAIGYVMLENGPRPLPPDATVTVVLGDFTAKHVKFGSGVVNGSLSTGSPTTT